MKRRNKLILLVNLHFCKIYRSEGTKVVDLIAGIPLLTHLHHKQPKHQGMFAKMSTQTHVFDSHTQARDTEYKEATQNLTHYINFIVNKNTSFKEIVLAAEPKMLGHIRKNLSSKIQELIVKEVPKDLVGGNIEDIEYNVL